MENQPGSFTGMETVITNRKGDMLTVCKDLQDVTSIFRETAKGDEACDPAGLGKNTFRA